MALFVSRGGDGHPLACLLRPPARLLCPAPAAGLLRSAWELAGVGRNHFRAIRLGAS